MVSKITINLSRVTPFRLPWVPETFHAEFPCLVTCVKTSFLVENVIAALDRRTREKKTYDTWVLFAPTFPEIFALITCAQALGVANRLLQFSDRAVARGLR